MSEIIYNLYEAKASLSRLVDRAANDAEPRQPGGWEGQMRISEDFDTPLPSEIQDAFEGHG